jgi:hypothetical protein
VVSGPGERARALDAIAELKSARRTRSGARNPDRTVEVMTDSTATGRNRNNQPPTLIERYRANALAFGQGAANRAQLAWVVQSMDQREQLRTPVVYDGVPTVRRIDKGRLPFTGILKALRWSATSRFETWWEHGRLYVVELPKGVDARHGTVSTLDDDKRLLLTEAMRRGLGLAEADSISVLADRTRNVAILESAARVFARAYPEHFAPPAPAPASHEHEEPAA